MLGKLKEEICENSYKVAAYEELLYLLKKELESSRNSQIYSRMLKIEGLLKLVYLETLDNERKFLQRG